MFLEIKVMMTALSVSYRSAFRISIRGIDLGQWMARFQADDFSIELKGNIRTVSAIQAVVSIYLFVIGIAAITGSVRVIPV